MAEQDYRAATSLIIVANEYPDQDFREKREQAHEGVYFKEIYMRWRDLFALLPSAKDVKWNEKIDFDDADMFYNTMRLVVESDATPPDLYADILAATDGLTIRWSEFLDLVPTAASVDWLAESERYTHPEK
ncbi:hypothetical protein KQI52_09755 [bacterium]|nr:hypothetical protein [bacterium]